MRLLDAKVSASPIETKCQVKTLVAGATKSDAFSEVLHALGACATTQSPTTKSATTQSAPTVEPSTDQKSPVKMAVETVDVSTITVEAPATTTPTVTVRVARSTEAPVLMEAPIASPMATKTSEATPTKEVTAKPHVRTSKREPRTAVATAPAIADVIVLTIPFVAPRALPVTVDVADGEAPPSGSDPPAERGASTPLTTPERAAAPEPKRATIAPVTAAVTPVPITELAKLPVASSRPMVPIAPTAAPVAKTTPSAPRPAPRTRIEPARQQPAADAATSPDEATDTTAPAIRVDAPPVMQTVEAPIAHEPKAAQDDAPTTDEPQRSAPDEAEPITPVTRAQAPSAKALTVAHAEPTTNTSAPVTKVEAPAPKGTTSAVVAGTKEATSTPIATRVERVLEAVKLHVAQTTKSARVDIGHGESKVTATIRVEDHRVTVHLVTADVELRSRLQTGLITLARDLKQRGFELDRVASTASLPAERTLSPRAVSSSQGMRFGTDTREHRERRRDHEPDEEQERTPSLNGRRTIAGRTYLG